MMNKRLKTVQLLNTYHEALYPDEAKPKHTIDAAINEEIRLNDLESSTYLAASVTNKTTEMDYGI